MSLDLSLYYPDFKFAMDNGGRNGIYEFDRFRLDADKLMLYRDGAEVSMPPKVVKTLLVLVEHRGIILSKEELIDLVWADAYVEESNLFQHLHRLRKVLGDRPDGDPFIETLRRRGYRFNGDVTWSAQRESNSDRPLDLPISNPRRASEVERDGNVLRFVEWSAPTEGPAPVPEASVVSVNQPRLRTKYLVAGAVLLFVVIAAIAAIQQYRSSVAPSGATSPEVSIVRLTSGIQPLHATISPNGDYFAYHETVEDGQKLWLHQVGQASRVQIGEAPQGTFYGPKTFSPDGKLLFLSVFEAASGKASLFRLPAIGGPRAKVLDDITGPVSFSPDGREFVFLRQNEEQRTTELVISDADGNHQRSLLQRQGPRRIVGTPAWSPDGKIILFASTDPDNKTRIYSTDLGAAEKPLAAESWDNVYRIVWLADGRGLVMIATRAGEGYTTKRDQVYYVSYPGGQARRLTNDGIRHQESSLGTTMDDAIFAIPFSRSSQIWSLAESGASASAIQISRGSADGRAGIAPLPDGTLGFISRVGENLGIWVMNPDGSALKQLSSGVLPFVDEIRADPKGRYFIFSGQKDGNSQLYRCDVGGGKLTQLTDDDSQPVDSAVSPDGNWIVYHSAVSGGLNRPPRLFRISIDGSKPEQFGRSECATPNYSPVGDRLSCVRGDEVVVLSAVDGSEIKTFKLLPYAQVNVGGRWTPDGRGIVYIRSDKGFGNLWVQPTDGGNAKQMTDFTIGDIYNFAFSSDGTRLFVARGQQVSDAVLIRNYR